MVNTPQDRTPPHPARPLTCPECPRSFKRREHLDRHMQGHSGARSFSCPFCSKQFSRKDSLQRHTRVHGTDAAQSLRFFRSTRACQRCAREKRRCIGEFPCLRCKEKNRQCSFKSPASPQGVEELAERRSPARRSSSVTDMQAATPLSVIEEDSATPSGTEQEIAFNVPFPDLRLDWEMQNTQLDDFFFSVPDMGYLFPWMAQADQSSSSAGQYPLPLETAIPPPPQFTSINSTPQGGHPRLPDPYTCGRRALSLFPQLQPSDHNILHTENSAHVGVIPARVYQEALSFFRLQQAAGFPCYAFPEKIVLDTFIQLYFENFDRLMPFLHCSFLERDDVHWILILAVASLGSQYTAIERRSQYIITLLELLRRALPTDAISVLNHDMTMIARSVLLYNVSLMFCGYRDYLVILEPQRAWLATLLQPFIGQSSSNSASNRVPYWSSEDEARDWQNWTQMEGQRRLVYCAWLFDSMAVVFHDKEPKLKVEDLDQLLPCNDAVWRARTASEWKVHFHSPIYRTVTTPNLRTLFHEFCSSGIDLTHASEFTKLLLLFTFWVEERRAVKGSRTLSLLHGNQPATSPASASDERLDAKFSRLQVVCPERLTLKLVDDDVLRARKTLYHILFILRHVPLKLLHSSSGWRASSSDAEKTRRSIAQWMQDNPNTARRCTFHAASAFCQIRSTASFDCLQAFSLLTAVLYLRLYQHEHIYIPPSTGREGDEAANSSQQPSQGLRKGITRTIRISPYQTEQNDLICQWISGEDPALALYIPGVGLLLEPLSQMCLLREFQRLLTSRELTGWPILRSGLGHNVEEIINEVTPLSQPPFSLNVEG